MKRLFRNNKETNKKRIKRKNKTKTYSKPQIALYKSFDNVSRGIFRTHLEIHDGALLKNK